VLTPQEIDIFFNQLRALKTAGKTILIITHKLKEVLALADNFTVLRQGRTVFSGQVAGQTTNSLGELMIGRHPKILSDSKNPNTPPPSISKKLLQFHGFNLFNKNKYLLKNINLNLNSSEIVGIAGVEGNGQSEILNMIVRPEYWQQQCFSKCSGEIKINNQNITKLSSQEIRNLGLSYFPEDRLRLALLLDSNAQENFLLGQHFRPKFLKHNLINWKSVKRSTAEMMQSFDVRPINLDLPLGQFSGGNQQKFVVGRELSQSPQILIAAQPTRGVDIGAIESIHANIINCKEQSAGVLLVSSDLDELMKLSDRIYVIFQGEIVGEFQAAHHYDEKKLGILMGGGQL
jgi:simple sugar transport system ATP-binding protein